MALRSLNFFLLYIRSSICSIKSQYSSFYLHIKCFACSCNNQIKNWNVKSKCTRLNSIEGPFLYVWDIIKIYIHLMYWMLNLILSLKVASDGEQQWNLISKHLKIAGLFNYYWKSYMYISTCVHLYILIALLNAYAIYLPGIQIFLLILHFLSLLILKLDHVWTP